MLRAQRHNIFRTRRSSSKFGRPLMGTIRVTGNVASISATDVESYGDGIFGAENLALKGRCGDSARPYLGRGCGFSGARGIDI